MLQLRRSIFYTCIALIAASTLGRTNAQEQVGGPTMGSGPVHAEAPQGLRHFAAPVAVAPLAEPALHQPDSATVWWTPGVSMPIRSEPHHLMVSVEDLLIRSLKFSSQVRVFSELPLIRETSVVEADAAFDWHAFLDSRWDDISDPVGNTLTVGGGGTRFEDNNLSSSFGARKRTHTGGQLELSQRFGHQRTNSTFFQPNPQGTSRLALSYTQPLLRGKGRVYNNSLKVLACLDTNIAKEEFDRQLQSHLLEVVRAYWGLYQERGIYLQKSRAFNRAQEVYQRLERRSQIDTLESQLISANAEVKSRGSALRRSAAAVLNAEDRIRALVNDPALGEDGCELIPIDAPGVQDFPVTMQEALSAAVQCRPEINQALKQIQASCVRVNMSRNELMPVLNLVTETYVSGLRGEGNSAGAFGDQFSVGEPSYSIGIQFEVPINNRAARARHIRRQMEMRQLQSQYQTTLQTLKLETRVAVREVETSFDELETKLAAMNAVNTKSDYIQRRWELLPGESRSGSQVLEDLLAAQAQLLRAENECLTAMVTYNLSLMNLKRATGMLLQHEQVVTGRTCLKGVPMQIVDKPFIDREPPVPPTDEHYDARPLEPTYDSIDRAPVFPAPLQPITPEIHDPASVPEVPAVPAVQASFRSSTSQPQISEPTQRSFSLRNLFRSKDRVSNR